MSKGPLPPAACLIVSGVLSLFVLYLLSTAGNQHRLVGPVSAAAFMLLVPVMLRGDSWQKMLAGALLFVSSFGLLMSVMDLKRSSLS